MRADGFESSGGHKERFNTNCRVGIAGCVVKERLAPVGRAAEERFRTNSRVVVAS
jgi:hypothetical protein